MNKKTFLIIICQLLFISVGFSRKIKVNSIDELKSAIKIADKGDSVILANNTYKDAGIIGVDASNIAIMAETNGGVVFTGDSRFKIAGSYNLFYGFQFKNGNVGGEKEKVIEVIGNYNIISQCNFYNIVSHNYIHFEEGSHHNECIYCNFEEKPGTKNAGPGIQITTSESVVNHTLIHYCTFQNFPGKGGDFGNEPIRIGLGKEQNNVSGAVVENCYFENLGLGDNESISIKSTGNVIRYNTFNNNPLGQVVFRTGNRNTAYGNYFFNSGGIRIKEGQHHMIYNNYFEGEGDSAYPAIRLMNFVLNQKSNVGLPLDDILIFHNTFYNINGIDLGGEGLNPPDHVVFANNIFCKKSGTVFYNDNNKVSFINNIFFGGAELGSTTIQSFIKTDPALTKNSLGYYVLSAKSPAIDAAVKTEFNILKNPDVENDDKIQMDFEGQLRSGKKDIGCDEYSNEKISYKPLKKSEAGPAYLNK